MSTNTDSFGQVVNVGDYVYFKVKTKYDGDALSIGRVDQITPKGTWMLTAINTYGKTIQEHRALKATEVQRITDHYTAQGRVPPSDLDERYGHVTFKQRLASASSMVRIPQEVLPPELVEAFNQ